MNKERIVTYRTDENQWVRILKVAGAAKWTVSQTIFVLVGEALSERECTELIRQAFGGEEGQGA